jgi:large subunit ribosomal protein L15
MSYAELIAGTANRKKPTRVGRGDGSKGKTCGRGHRGVGARRGPNVRAGYEGGQTPAFRRLPKRGFSNAQFETRYVPVNVASLNRFPDGATVDKAALLEARLVRKKNALVKILGGGKLERKLDVVADGFSKSAVAKIEAAGGSARTG